jgi:hypothetical protein
MPGLYQYRRLYLPYNALLNRSMLHRRRRKLEGKGSGEQGHAKRRAIFIFVTRIYTPSRSVESCRVRVSSASFTLSEMCISLFETY